MAVTRINHCAIVGLAAAVPRGTVENAEYPGLSAEEAQKLIKATGIKRRRIADAEVCTSDLCAAAAQKLLAQLGWKREEVGALVFVTQTPDYHLPATAPILQHRLGLAKGCLAYDIILGCSGYVYGLASLASMVSAMGISRALLLVGETTSKNSSGTDKSVTPLFGDAGTATAVVFDVNAAPMHLELCSDGAGHAAIMIPDGGYRNVARAESLVVSEEQPGISRNRMHVRMSGPDVFNFTLREVPPSVTRVCEAAGVGLASADAYVFHQANLMMNELIRKKLGIPPEKHPYTLDDFGNTSSATIPLTLATRCQALLAGGPATFVLSGFGVGLSWGTMVIRTQGVVCPPLIEI